MATEIPASITTPDRVETRLGTLRFFDGLPDEETVQKVFDNLDFQRGVQAFLVGLAAASAHAMRTGIRTFGSDNQTVLIAESLVDARSLFLTGNTETVYDILWLDTKDGPLVVDVPARVLGIITDFWYRYVTDVGNVGPDQGRGGKYLLLPPGFTGDVPDGYHVLHSRTYGNWMFFRAFIEDGNLRTAVDTAKAGFRVYRLDQAASPPPMNFVNISGVELNTIHANDASFFQELATVVQEEPLDAVDPETRGLLASIGIQKGRPFEPDARMQRILTDAAAVGNATARALVFHTRDRKAYYYPGSAWKMWWVDDDFEFSPGGVLNLDGRTQYFYVGTGSSPVFSRKMVGKSSQYAWATQDANGQYLDGAKSYRLHLPAGIPAGRFWSILLYDSQTRSMLQTDQQFPSVSSQKKDLAVNPDTSVDVYFSPTPPPGKEANWIQTVPGKGWWTALRLYSPLEPWFDKTWRPGEIEPVP